MQPALQRQGRIGVTLAVLIIGVWTVLHVMAVFFTPLAFTITTVAFVIALTWLSVGLFIVAHDAMHGSLWPLHRRTGNAIGAVALLLYAGFSFYRLLPKHHAHHDHPGSPDDPDFAPETPNQPFAWYVRFTRTYFGWRELVIMTLRVVVYWLLGAAYGNIIVFYALPSILASFQLFYFGTFLPHRHEADPAVFADHHNARSNNYTYLVSLLTCFHFGYHHEHHLKPGTPWWQLPRMRKTLSA